MVLVLLIYFSGRISVDIKGTLAAEEIPPTVWIKQVHADFVLRGSSFAFNFFIKDYLNLWKAHFELDDIFSFTPSLTAYMGIRGVMSYFRSTFLSLIFVLFLVSWNRVSLYIIRNTFSIKRTRKSIFLSTFGLNLFLSTVDGMGCSSVG